MRPAPDADDVAVQDGQKRFYTGKSLFVFDTFFYFSRISVSQDSFRCEILLDVPVSVNIEVELEADVRLVVDAHVEPGSVDDYPVLDLHHGQFQLRQDLQQVLRTDARDHRLRGSADLCRLVVDARDNVLDLLHGLLDSRFLLGRFDE